MKSKMMANDLPYLDDHIPNCKACQFGKQNRKPFPKATWRASKKLQLIHLDIASPQGTPSLKEFKLSYQTIARNTHLNHSIDSARRWAFNINLPLHILRNKMKLPTRAVKDQTPFEAWDVHFVEDEKWNWEDAKQNNKDWQNDMVDDVLVKGTRLFSDVYHRCNIAICEPADYEEAMKNQNWMIAMKEELSMTEKNKHGFLLKGLETGRLVVKGYNQNFGADYSNTFTPVARLDTIRMLLAVAAQNDWRVYQLDVKSVFLNGYLQEEIYVEKPEGFVKE
ncbi:Retrovirus-related Pol polyprotein from transposon TNT 1-94 [Vitis vinifera]|uniref:Retrovirus-related Pol polyprotein from transposon TNT 1-94 n=1 Tax=Vitis vinifera TaxID=29760 RepID=A0A438H6M7_VITVI|nr:Retrovirus-related Pol polyprotein from transposon TNT 1-94 [Vitis vinifera]